MKYIWLEYKDKIRKILVDGGLAPDDIVFELPPKGIAGDVAIPCFAMAKKMRKSPAQIALEIIEILKGNDLIINRAEVVGPYVNIFFNRGDFTKKLIEEVKKCGECYGSLPANNIKIGVEYLEPNTNKALTIGHARNGTIGRSLVEVLKYAGFKVTAINLYNDRGVHICKSMLAYQKWGGGQTPEDTGMKPDHFVGKYYVLFNEKAQQDEKLNDEVQNMLQDWENGKKEVIDLWKKMNGWFYDGVNQTLDRVGIKFDQIYYESEIYKYGKDIVEESLKKGLSYRLDDGAVEVDLSAVGLDKKILLRRDGTTVYIVQDLFLAKKKIEDFGLDRSIYIVANEQKYHFDVLFELLDRFGITDKKKTYHLSYGMVNAASGKKMSSRKGTGESWDSLLDELRSMAEQEIVERNSDLTREEIEKRAECIAEAALKFALLNQDINKTINFNKEEIVKFEGETGPYLLYTYARMNSILEKNNDNIECNLTEYENEIVYDVLKDLSRFCEIIERVSEDYNPALLTNYLYSTCQKFNNFYHQYRVLDEPDESKKLSRLCFVSTVQTVLKTGLGLAGIEVIEKM